MPAELAIAFVVIFGGALAAAFGALKFLEQRRKQQVASVLKTIAGDPPPPQTKILKDLPGENRGLLERLLGSFNIAGRTEAVIRQAGLDWTVERLFMLAAIGACLGALFGSALVRSLPVPARALLGGSIGAAVPYLSVMRKRSKRLAAFEEQLPEALDFLARSMRAGHAFSISLEMMSDEMPDPVGMEFRTLFNEQNLGAPIELALKNLTERVPLLDVRFFASAVMMQRQTGGNLSEIL